MLSVILYMLRQTADNRVPLLLFPSFSPLTVTFPKLSVILRPLYDRWWQQFIETVSPNQHEQHEEQPLWDKHLRATKDLYLRGV
jgi:hypothetical protein